MLPIRLVILLLCCGATALAQAPAKSVPDAKDPQYRVNGDTKRSYFFAETNETMPYRVLVPSTWDGKKKLPLVVMLHGGGLTQDAPFDRAPENLKGIVTQEAEKHGFILVAPLGYNQHGAYGSLSAPPPPPPPGADAPPRPAGAPPQGAGGPPVLTPEERKRVSGLSEKDVLNVIERTAKEYNVDRSRIYLMGNSMGEIGTLHLTQKYPQMWRAIAPSGGPIDAAGYPFEKVKVKGAFFIQGELDKGPRDNHARQKALADGFKAQGVAAELVIVPGGNHSTAWYIVLPQIFDFFEKHKK